MLLVGLVVIIYIVIGVGKHYIDTVGWPTVSLSASFFLKCPPRGLVRVSTLPRGSVRVRTAPTVPM